MRSTRSLMAAGACGAAIAVLGKKEDFSQGRSICKFSGLDDDPTGTQGEGPGGRTQSYGQDVRMGLANPRAFNPGDACNPNAPAPPE